MHKVSRPTVSLVKRCSPHNNGPSSFIFSFLPCFQWFFFFRQNELWSFPLAREPFFRLPSELLGKLT